MEEVEVEYEASRPRKVGDEPRRTVSIIELRKAPMWAVFHIETGKQLCKSVHHREVAIIEAYELGLIVRGRGKVWLSGDYEIREV